MHADSDEFGTAGRLVGWYADTEHFSRNMPALHCSTMSGESERPSRTFNGHVCDVSDALIGVCHVFQWTDSAAQLNTVIHATLSSVNIKAVK